MDLHVPQYVRNSCVAAQLADYLEQLSSMELDNHVIILKKAQISIYLLFLLYFPSPRIYFFTQKGEEQEKNKKKTLINITTIPHITRQDKNTS
jgi:hypothetical protein